MVNEIKAQVIGGSAQVMGTSSPVPAYQNINTVADVKRALGAQTYKAMVNQEPANDSDVLQDGDFVSLSPAVKGGC